MSFNLPTMIPLLLLSPMSVLGTNASDPLRLESVAYPGSVWSAFIYGTVGVPVDSRVTCSGFCAAESPTCTVFVVQGDLCHLGNAGPHTFLPPQPDTQLALRDVYSKMSRSL